MVEKINFEEAQSFGLIGVVPAIVALVFGILCYVQVIKKRQVGNHPASNWLLGVIFLLTSAFAITFITQKLHSSISNREVMVDFGVFGSKRIFPLSDIRRISLRNYNGMKEFSGWGVKGNATEQSYTVSGNEGVELNLKSGGRRILIGTHQPDEWQKAINDLRLNQH